MSNLQTARKAIIEAVQDAQQQQRKLARDLTALQATLVSLDKMIAGKAETTSVKKPNKAPKDSTPRLKDVTQTPPAKPVKSASKQSGSLPKTGNEFWLGLLGSEPLGRADIFAAACTALNIKPDAEQQKKLQFRMASTLDSMVKTQQVRSDGKGRQRTFAAA